MRHSFPERPYTFERKRAKHGDVHEEIAGVPAEAGSRFLWERDREDPRFVRVFLKRGIGRRTNDLILSPCPAAKEKDHCCEISRDNRVRCEVCDWAMKPLEEVEAIARGVSLATIQGEIDAALAWVPNYQGPWSWPWFSERLVSLPVGSAASPIPKTVSHFDSGRLLQHACDALHGLQITGSCATYQAWYLGYLLERLKQVTELDGGDWPHVVNTEMGLCVEQARKYTQVFDAFDSPLNLRDLTIHEATLLITKPSVAAKALLKRAESAGHYTVSIVRGQHYTRLRGSDFALQVQLYNRHLVEHVSRVREVWRPEQARELGMLLAHSVGTVSNALLAEDPISADSVLETARSTAGLLTRLWDVAKEHELVDILDDATPASELEAVKALVEIMNNPTTLRDLISLFGGLRKANRAGVLSQAIAAASESVERHIR